MRNLKDNNSSTFKKYCLLLLKIRALLAWKLPVVSLENNRSKNFDSVEKFRLVENRLKPAC
jgi:hypothetical protein